MVDNLFDTTRRYAATVRAIQNADNLDRRTTIQPSRRPRIPGNPPRPGNRRPPWTFPPERMAARLHVHPEVMDRRRELVEHPFGSIKQWMGQGAFLTRRIEHVRAEFSLTALACNIRRAINLVGVPALLAATTD